MQSCTVQVVYELGAAPQSFAKAAAEVSGFGEVARLDLSLGEVLGCILVTFFDVRSAKKLIESMPQRAELFPPASHEFRQVCLPMQPFVEIVQQTGSMQSFGDVANINMSRIDGVDQVIVEFFDLRAAQRLLQVSGRAGRPWPPRRSAETSNATPATSQAAPPTPDKAAPKPGPAPKKAAKANKDLSQFDIDPSKIRSGADQRTTVMIRGLSGCNARNDLLQCLEIVGLGDSYTFFYMPCKEYRNVAAGFAFVNFEDAHDVLSLYSTISTVWKQVCQEQTKAPIVSYARFQGHHELMRHFSSSAVLHDQDPEKRPIFKKNWRGQATKERKPVDSSMTVPERWTGHMSKDLCNSMDAAILAAQTDAFTNFAGGAEPLKVDCSFGQDS